eukprot:GHVP01062246.1.p2 GENE.GHVP01062246.1~~GHVP01062246.1.p2  ORF type:complete len:121 (+),score=1.55 GHVP01062246.1:737-1099(+)
MRYPDYPSYIQPVTVNFALAEVLGDQCYEDIDSLEAVLKDDNGEQRLPEQLGNFQHLISRYAKNLQRVLSILENFPEVFTNNDTTARVSFKTTDKFKTRLEANATPVNNMNTRLTKNARA